MAKKASSINEPPKPKRYRYIAYWQHTKEEILRGEAAGGRTWIEVLTQYSCKQDAQRRYKESTGKELSWKEFYIEQDKS